MILREQFVGLIAIHIVSYVYSYVIIVNIWNDNLNNLNWVGTALVFGLFQ